MRALCGAIITAGALIGLGLTALAFGIRFQDAGFTEHPNTKAAWGATSMTICMIVLLVSVFVGIGTAFLGLMFHHERRYMELHPEEAAPAGKKGKG
jgi:hypothetical protein